MFQKAVFLVFFAALPLLTGHSLNSRRTDHAIYIGVVKIVHQPFETQATIDIKVFTDDLQSALQNAFGFEKVIGKLSLCEQNSSRINQYFLNYFHCEINGQATELRLKNCEEQNEVFWLAFEIFCPENWKEIALKADFFMELFPDQSNVLSVYEGNEKRFGRVTNKQKDLAFNF